MADAKISALTNYTTPIGTDVLPIVDVTNVITKKIPLNVLSSRGLLGQTTYGGGSYTIGVSTTTMANLDTTNLIVTFTAPASGAVDVELDGYLSIYNAGGTVGNRNLICWGLLNTAGNTTYGPVKRVADSGSGATGVGGLGTAQVTQRIHIVIGVTGLTSGNSYTFAWAALDYQVSGTATTTMTGDSGTAPGVGPFDMRVRSA